MPWLTATPDKPNAGQEQEVSSAKRSGSVAPIAYHQDTDEVADQDIVQPRILCQAFALGER
jgi:hypothetical protein